MLAEGLHAFLVADTGIAALLKTSSQRADSQDGIFPTIAPSQCSLPYIVFQQVGGMPLETSFQGTGRLQTSRWRFSCYAGVYKDAKQLAKVLKRALISCLGELPQGNAFIEGAWVLLEADDIETVPRATIYATHLDFEIIWADYDDA